MRNAGRVVTREALMDRVWDENWFGSTKTLDVHMRWLRGKLGETAENAHYLQTVRGVGFRFRAPEEPVSLRSRLLLALAYVLLLAIVALEVPLALNLRDRVDREVRSQALSQAEVAAATSAGQLGRAGELRRIATTVARSARGRVVIVDRAGAVIADSAGRTPRRRLLEPPRDRRGAARQHVPGAAPLADPRRRDPRHRPARARPRQPEGAVRVTQSVEAVNRATRASILGLIAIGGVVLLLGLAAGALIARQIAGPLRRLDEAAARVSEGDLAARARSRAARSSARSPPRSTR